MYTRAGTQKRVAAIDAFGPVFEEGQFDLYLLSLSSPHPEIETIQTKIQGQWRRSRVVGGENQTLIGRQPKVL